MVDAHAVVSFLIKLDDSKLLELAKLILIRGCAAEAVILCPGRSVKAIVLVFQFVRKRIMV